MGRVEIEQGSRKGASTSAKVNEELEDGTFKVR